LEQTVVFVFASLIVAVIAFTIVLHYAIPRETVVPETYPVDLQISQTLACTNYNTIHSNDYDYSIPTSRLIYLTLFAKSYAREYMYIDKIVPNTQPNKPLSLSITLPPEGYILQTLQTPWSIGGQITTTVYPGDIVNLGFILQITPGTIYSSGAPINYISQITSGSYNFPFTGGSRTTLDISGQEISARIRTPGSAGVVITNINQSKVLILADYMVGNYYYQDDVPFFIDVYNAPSQQVGFFREPSSVGTIYGTRLNTVSTTNNGYQAAAFWYDGSYGNLYLDNSMTPVLRTPQISVSGGKVIVGVARQSSATNIPSDYYVSSYVNYVGVFKDKTITVTGLMSGDTVVLSAGGVTQMFTANGNQISIDLLSIFTPSQILSAVMSGGIQLTIISSQSQSLSFLPTSARVHISTAVHDMWIDVNIPVNVNCNSSLFVHSQSGTQYITTLYTSDYKVWNITFSGNSLGIYPGVLITVMNGTVKVYSATTGTYTYAAPNQNCAVKIDLSPIGYAGVQICSQLSTIPYVYYIQITGTMYYIALSYGK